MRVDDAKVKAVMEWPTQKIIDKVWSFLKLAAFYKWFIRNFNIVVAPMAECKKKWKFT